MKQLMKITPLSLRSLNENITKLSEASLSLSSVHWNSHKMPVTKWEYMVEMHRLY